MERDYNNGDFELFLQEKANQHRLYPTEKVWKNIYSSLHPKRKWFTWTGALLLISSLFLLTRTYIFPDRDKDAAVENQQGNPASHNSDQSPDVFFTPSGQQTPFNGKIKNNIPASPGIQHNIAVAEPELQPAVIKHIPPVGTKAIVVTMPALTTTPALQQVMPPEPAPAIVTQAETLQPGSGHESGEDIVINPIRKDVNWLQEKAVLQLSPRRRSPFNFQLYFSPTISYRTLTDNNTNPHSASRVIPLANYQPAVDRFVDHKPALGVELGSNVLFNASRSFILKTGLQLNYNRYSIKAYKFYFEKASIALNSTGPVPDTITALTPFRNFSGYTPEQLQNHYVQISVPIGAELKLLGNNKLQISIAGTIQPSYLLYNDTYLLTDDFLNYAKEPSLMRRWNVNTSFESFISYKTGDLRWQVGPQFRYQLLSSFNDRYPIREYLIEYGIKFGVSKTLK